MGERAAFTVRILALFLVALFAIPVVIARAQVVTSQAGPGCSNPYQDAVRYDDAPSHFDKRNSSVLFTTRRTVTIAVNLSAGGTIQSSAIYATSGMAYLDNDALMQARESKYTPRMVNCVAVAAQILERFVYDPPGFQCSDPDETPKLLKAPTAAWPQGAMSGVPVTITVRVTIDTNGNVTDAAVTSHTGDEPLGDALTNGALNVVRNLKFSPATSVCEAVASEGIYSVEFDPPPTVVAAYQGTSYQQPQQQQLQQQSTSLEGTAIEPIPMAVVTPPPTPTPAPTPAYASYVFQAAAPTPSPTPICKIHARPASVIAAVPPQYPAAAVRLNLGTVSVLLDVKVAADGRATVSVYQSSGNADIDQAALRAAQRSTYAPKITECRAVTSDTIFRAQFNGPAQAPPGNDSSQSSYNSPSKRR